MRLSVQRDLSDDQIALTGQPYISLDDLQNVNGIGPAALEKLKEWAYVE